MNVAAAPLPAVHCSIAQWDQDTAVFCSVPGVAFGRWLDLDWT